MKITENQLRKLIKEEMSKEEQLRSIDTAVDVLRLAVEEFNKLTLNILPSDVEDKIIAARDHAMSAIQNSLSADFRIKNPHRRRY